MTSLKCSVDPASLAICSDMKVSPVYLSSLPGTLKLHLVVGLQTTHLLAPNYISTSTISFLQLVFSEFFRPDLFFLMSPTQSPSSVHYLQYSVSSLEYQTQVSTVSIDAFNSHFFCIKSSRFVSAIKENSSVLKTCEKLPNLGDKIYT